MGISYVGLIASAVSATGGASAALTVGAGVPVGDLVVVSVGVGNSTTAPSAPTSTKITWRATVDAVRTQGLDSMFVWSGVVNTALVNGDVITVNIPSGNTEYLVRADQVTGNVSTAWLDVSAVGSNAGSNAPTVSVTNVNANDLMWGAIMVFTQGGTVSWANSYANAGSSPTVVSTTDDLWNGSLVVSSAASQTAALSGVSGTPEWLAAIVGYIAAGGAVVVANPSRAAMRRPRAAPRRSGRFFMAIPAQVNPPFTAPRWRRPFVASVRFFMRRARIVTPIRPQVNPPFDLSSWWRRAMEATNRQWRRRPPFRYDLPVRPQVNPPMPPVWFKRFFLAVPRALAPRRARRFEVTRSQVNPPFSNDWWRRAFQAAARRFTRRARFAEPPWGQAAVAGPPTFVSWPVRLRRAQGWLRRRAGSLSPPIVEEVGARPARSSARRFFLRRRPSRWQAPDVQVGAPSGPRRARLITSVRRSRFWSPPFVQVVIANPVIVEFWRRSRTRWSVIRSSRAVRFVPTGIAPIFPILRDFISSVQGIGSAVAQAAVSAISSVAGIGKSDTVQGGGSVGSQQNPESKDSEVEGR